MTNTHLTIENVEKLAKLMLKNGLVLNMNQGRELAEFNLRYSKSYAEAAARMSA
jgi:hypothetical protein